METSATAPLTLNDILADAPAIQGTEENDDIQAHGLIPAALDFIERTVKRGDRTLETGSGFSTMLLAILGANHTCIVPNAYEVERIKSYLDSRGASHDHVTFYTEPSQDVLPRLDLEPLDLVLIDGSHSFPQVFIDWFYVASALKIGGTLVVDDVHVWTGRVLRDFLRAEPEWEFVEEFTGRTAVFRKKANIDPDKIWTEQRYVMRRSGAGLQAQGRMAVSMLRHGQRKELAGLVRSKLGR